MSNSFEHDAMGGHATPSLNLGKITGMATALVVLNVVLMLVLAYAVGPIAQLLFSNFFIGIAVFVVTVGGGFWVANKGVQSGNYPLAGVGVTMIQAGYGLFGAAILAAFGGQQGLWIPALAITAVITGLITAVVALVVFKTDHSFANWQKYSWGFFIGGFALGAVGFFINPMLMLVAGLLFFLGFVVDLTYEIWAVKANRYESDLRNALGIYVAVMGVFVHVLQLVLRVLSMLDN
ncbi:hypothetical protein SAMN05216559_0482 [Halomicrobium zhouii]|uniref:Bax inhibitor-1/YccA family protein n=1 Tax=Halomicrobium zhouii TaxID=767519 RepID=A0A1I6KB20_9EURY|nr:hypothetical protein [Halomicrobium zhouii]SFR88397.1 hypothetical protein SAMN05216559_0482 [Halomicrobium zhouii]